MKSFKMSTGDEPTNDGQDVKEVRLVDEKDTQTFKKVAKYAGIGIAILLGIKFWYIAVPALAVWYLYKRDTRLSSKTRMRLSVGITAVFFMLGGITLYSNRAPSLVIAEPADAAAVQSERITVAGEVSPKDSTVTVNGIPVEVDDHGHFSYDIRLKNENNPLTIEAAHGSKKSSQTLTVARIFTEEEKEAVRVAEVEAAKENIRREIASLNKPFDGSNFRGSVVAMQLEIALFGAYAKTVADYKQHPDPEVKALANQMEAKVGQLQVSEFPKLRKAYADLIAKEMWENDMEVSVAGSANKTIVFTAAMFASNKNIAEAHGTLQETLGLFRFTRANYKWYTYDSEYSFYKIDSPADSKVVQIGQ
ncbi:MAG TPA: hypothetical protein VGB97_02105 [Candidatus Paceibacterota bacterium]|jgi:hypothetical protein